MNTMCVERSAAEPEFQAGWPRPRGPTKADIGKTLPPLQHVAPAGSSKVEPGTTPATDVTLTYATVDALAAACGASRLDGGMHFTGAVEAGEELCKGIGTAGFEYASDLIGGEW